MLMVRNLRVKGIAIAAMSTSRASVTLRMIGELVREGHERGARDAGGGVLVLDLSRSEVVGSEMIDLICSQRA
jgi:hypothetical protein